MSPSALYVTSSNEIITQDSWTQELSFYRADFKKYRVTKAPQPRSIQRISPNSSRKDIPQPSLQVDHPDFGLWVNHCLDLSVLDFRDNSERVIYDFLADESDGCLISVGISLSIRKGLIIGISYSLDPSEYRKYYLTLWRKEEEKKKTEPLKDISSTRKFILK